MRRVDASGLIGILLLILVISGGTVAVIMYKNYDVKTALVYIAIGIAVLFFIGLLFTGIKLPTPRSQVRAVWIRYRFQKLYVHVLTI